MHRARGHAHVSISDGVSPRSGGAILATVYIAAHLKSLVYFCKKIFDFKVIFTFISVQSKYNFSKIWSLSQQKPYQTSILSSCFHHCSSCMSGDAPQVRSRPHLCPVRDGRQHTFIRTGYSEPLINLKRTLFCLDDANARKARTQRGVKHRIMGN